MVIFLATKQMGQKGILVSADNSCKIMLRITVRIIPDFEHPELFEMFQAPRNRHIYSSNALIKRSRKVYISSVAKKLFWDPDRVKFSGDSGDHHNFNSRLIKIVRCVNS